MSNYENEIDDNKLFTFVSLEDCNMIYVADGWKIIVEADASIQEFKPIHKFSDLKNGWITIEKEY